MRRDSPRPGSIRGNRIYGSKGEIIVSNPLLVRTSEDTEFGKANEWHEIKLEEKAKHINRFIEGFAEAVLSNRTPPVTGEDGRKALEIIVAAYQSAQKSMPINLPL